MTTSPFTQRPRGSWLVARTDAPERLAAAAGVRALRPFPRDGGPTSGYSALALSDLVAAARALPGVEPSCVVARPVEGWSVVVSDRLPTHRGDDALSALLARVSAALDGAEVLAFASLAQGDYQAWSRAEGGQVRRVFYWFGAEDRAHAQGERTPAEAQLGLPAQDPTTTAPEDVLAVARGWGIDLALLSGDVWLGSLPDPEAARQAAREATLDQAARDVAAALEVEVQEDVDLAPSGGGGDARERLDGMAAHMASLGYQVVWSGDRTRFEATPPEGVSLPPMAFGLDDV